MASHLSPTGGQIISRGGEGSEPTVLERCGMAGAKYTAGGLQTKGRIVTYTSVSSSKASV